MGQCQSRQGQGVLFRPQRESYNRPVGQGCVTAAAARRMAAEQQHSTAEAALRHCQQEQHRAAAG
jgi:hypothetical protein